MNTTLSVTRGNITEYNLNWPRKTRGSTHELVIDEQHIFVSEQNMDCIAKCNYEGQVVDYYKMPDGSGPHGLLLINRGGFGFRWSFLPWSYNWMSTDKSSTKSM